MGDVEKKTKKKSRKKKKSPLSLFWRNLIASALLVAGAFVVLIFASAKDEIHEGSTWKIEDICELATLECRYHNVVVHREDGGFIWDEEEYWLEYDGIVTVGIPADKVIIEEPTADGVVKIYLPPVEVFSTMVDEDSIDVVINDSELFGSNMGGEEQGRVANEAQETMLKQAQADMHIFNYAFNNAKNILEQYVINVGKMVGKAYTVEWVEPEEIRATESATEATE